MPLRTPIYRFCPYDGILQIVSVRVPVTLPHLPSPREVLHVRQCCPPPRLFDQIVWCCRRRQYSPRTAEAYVYWSGLYILFHGKRHPKIVGPKEVQRFLDSLVASNVAVLTHSQALSALVFLYREVLGTPFGWLDDLVRPKRPKNLPTVLSLNEVGQVLAAMKGSGPNGAADLRLRSPTA
ncbi:MAG: phage integrase N-terminal SAM-like domain-containing protein [Isosphaerales bacterium]